MILFLSGPIQNNYSHNLTITILHLLKPKLMGFYDWLLLSPCSLAASSFRDFLCAKIELVLLSLSQVGEEGAGHFVKMVHNGIEYGDMQVKKIVC